MKLDDFNYELPEEFIAQSPLEKRDNSKLLVYNRASKQHEIDNFFNILDYLKKGDVLVWNSTKVIPARLLAVKERTSAKIELLLLKKLSSDTYSTLVKPLKRLKINDRVFLGGKLIGVLIQKDDAAGTAVMRFEGNFSRTDSVPETDKKTANIDDVLENLGEVPLPHYITKKLENKDRYQTVYAKEAGSIAAPTAGLHWTPELIAAAKAKGVIFAPVLLHVGLGTFRPVKVDDITKHQMHSEYYEISAQTAEIIRKAKHENRRVICVGTTSMRTLESYAKTGLLCGDTDIFIYPPYEFKMADALITNFHLPKSTLLMLVSAFAGREKVLELYETAKKNYFRFFSFGDCMFIS